MDSNNGYLVGKFCPYPVVTIICTVARMQHGEQRRFIVDDPLATKSVPEELEEFDDVRCEIHEHEEGWEIIVWKD